MRKVGEEGNAFADEDGNPRDREPLDHASGEEPLDRDTAVDVGMAESSSVERNDDLAGRAGQALDDGTGGCGGERSRAEDDDRLRPIGPRGKAEDRLVRLAADDQDVDRGHELVVAVRL